MNELEHEINMKSGNIFMLRRFICIKATEFKRIPSVLDEENKHASEV